MTFSTSISGRMETDPVRDYFESACLGRLRGTTCKDITAWSSNFASGTRIVWALNEDYNFLPSVQTSLYLTSSDDTDQSNISIFSTTLDHQFNESSQTTTLSGHTPKLVTTDGIRVNSCLRIGPQTHQGDVYLISSTNVTNGVPNDSADIVAYLPRGSQIKEQSVYTVPNGKRAILLDSLYTTGRNDDATFNMAIRANDEFDYSSLYFANVYQSGHRLSGKLPFLVPSKYDLYTLVTSSQNGIRCSVLHSFMVFDDSALT